MNRGGGARQAGLGATNRQAGAEENRRRVSVSAEAFLAASLPHDRLLSVLAAAIFEF